MSDNDNAAEVFSRPNVSARIHDFEQFTLWTNTPDRPGFRSRMAFGERNGAARISVFPNYESGPKVLFVGMHPMIFMEFLARWTKIAKGPNGKTDKIVNMDREPNAERTADADKVNKIVRNTLWIGKDDEGVCWIAIEQPNIKNIRFKILSSVWHHFYKEDGSQVTPAEGSAAQTVALIESLRMAMAPYIARLRPAFDKNAAKPKAAGGGDDPKKLTTFAVDEDINY